MIGGRWDKATREITDDRLSDERPKQKDSAFTGRTGLVYLFDNGLAPYLSYATSFNPEIGEDAQGNAFKPTTGQQYEVGVKFQPEGGTTSITLAVFNLVQQNVVTTDPANQNFSIQTGEIRSRGIELEGKGNLTRNLGLIAAYTYLDAEITQSNDGNQGDRPGGISKHRASLWLDYTLRQGTLRGLGLGGGARYISSYYEENPRELTSGYTLVDLAAHYDLGDYRIALNVDNALDKEIFNPTGYGPSRTARMTLNYNF